VKKGGARGRRNTMRQRLPGGENSLGGWRNAYQGRRWAGRNRLIGSNHLQETRPPKQLFQRIRKGMKNDQKRTQAAAGKLQPNWRTTSKGKQSRGKMKNPRWRPVGGVPRTDRVSRESKKGNERSRDPFAVIRKSRAWGTGEAVSNRPGGFGK